MALSVVGHAAGLGPYTPQAAGNTLVVIGSALTTTPLSKPTDTQGNFYVHAGDYNDTSWGFSVYYCKITGSSALTITFAGGSRYWIIELSGGALADALTGAGTHNGTAGSTVGVPSFTTTASGEVAIATFVSNSGTNATDAPTGWTAGDSSSSEMDFWIALASSGTYSAMSNNAGTGGGFIAVVVSFEPGTVPLPPAPAGPKQAEIQHYKIGYQVLPGAAPSAFAPVPTAEDLQGGTTGVAYTETISAQGGTSPYTFSVVSGALPTSLSMSSAGLISGTPSATGTFTFTVKVVDAHGYSGTTQFQITISAPSAAGGNYGFVA